MKSINGPLLFFALLFLIGYSIMLYYVVTEFSIGLFVTWLLITGAAAIIGKLMWNDIKDIFK